MTTPTGTISMSDVNAELSKVSTALITLNDTDVRNLAGVFSGTISMDDLRGKSAVNYGTLTPNYTVRAEGQSFTFTLSGGTAVPNGTYYWRVEYGSNLSVSDFVSTTGSFTVTSNTGSFTVTTYDDSIDEGNGTFRVVVGDASGVPVTYVASQYVTVTETTTYTVTASKTSIYRYGGFLTDRNVTFTLDTTRVPDGTQIYYKLVSVSGTIEFSNTANTGDLLGAQTGSRTVVGTLSSGTAAVGVSAVEYLDGTARTSRSFTIKFYTDAALTNEVASGPTVTIRAAPSYTIGFSPTSINEGSTSTCTVTAANFPLGFSLYYTTSGTASATSDWVGGSSSGSFVMSSSSVSFSVTAAYDSTTESSETLTFNLRTVSTAGDIVKNATVTFVQSLGTIGTLTASKTGGALNGSVSISISASGLTAYPLARTFSVSYSLNGAAYTQSGLSATTATCNANSTTIASKVIYSNATATTAVNGTTGLKIKLTLAGHSDKISNTLTSFYL